VDNYCVREKFPPANGLLPHGGNLAETEENDEAKDGD